MYRFGDEIITVLHKQECSDAWGDRKKQAVWGDYSGRIGDEANSQARSEGILLNATARQFFSRLGWTSYSAAICASVFSSRRKSRLLDGGFSATTVKTTVKQPAPFRHPPGKARAEARRCCAASRGVWVLVGQLAMV